MEWIQVLRFVRAAGQSGASSQLTLTRFSVCVPPLLQTKRPNSNTTSTQGPPLHTMQCSVFFLAVLAILGSTLGFQVGVFLCFVLTREKAKLMGNFERVTFTASANTSCFQVRAENT